MYLVAPIVELVAVALLQQLAERRDLAQRFLQVVRGDVGELLKLGVGAAQLGGLRVQVGGLAGRDGLRGAGVVSSASTSSLRIPRRRRRRRAGPPGRRARCGGRSHRPPPGRRPPAAGAAAGRRPAAQHDRQRRRREQEDDQDGHVDPVLDGRGPGCSAARSRGRGRGQAGVLRGEQRPQVVEGLLAPVQLGQVTAAQRARGGQLDQRDRVGAPPGPRRLLDPGQVAGQRLASRRSAARSRAAAAWSRWPGPRCTAGRNRGSPVMPYPRTPVSWSTRAPCSR